MPNTIEWSEKEMQLLVNLRRNKNEDYWRRFGRSKVPFWDEIAIKIQEDLGTAFTGVQAREKFKGMIKDCKLFEKYADGKPGGRWTHVGEVFGEQFMTQFWKRPGWHTSRVEQRRLMNINPLSNQSNPPEQQQQQQQQTENNNNPI